MKKLIAFAALSALYLQGYSQSIIGKITDAQSGEPLPAASILVLPSGPGNVSGSNGNYTISLREPGNYTLEVSFLGYETLAKEVYVEEENTRLNFSLEPKQELLEPVNISAVRAAKDVPIAKSDLSSEEIEAKDEGRDIPFILKDLPSTVVTSDAGAGIGYTGIRIRGSDISRINVTVNGIPLNDPESHGVFWVNTPDLASSTQSIQVQRGVGTSTNGAGAFGASINLNTSSLNRDPYATSEILGGSFNTRKANLRVGSGLLNEHWIVEGRVSKIQSDGFIDRASADLSSYYLSASYYSENTSLQLIHFGGEEKTYQAWWGIPEAKLFENDSALQYHIAVNGYDSEDSANLVNSDPRTYNYYTYENEVDNYKQDHYQLHLSHRFTKNLVANAALHYTWGRGYYEQYRKDDDLAGYGLDPVAIGSDTVNTTDLIRRRWLNNDLYGLTYSLEYNRSNLNVTLGGAYNEYVGDHYGEIIWARYASDSEIRDRYYDNTSYKSDFNTYLKANMEFGKLNLFGDLQLRAVNYTGSGIDEDQSVINIDENFVFFNPKGGVNYSLTENSRVFASVAVAQREPVRTDFLDARTDLKPQSEFLIDYEAGYEWRNENSILSANIYYMDYTNQLVNTGQLNDVGAAIRVNVPESYRTGVELAGQYKLTHWLQAGANLTLSQNKILNYTDYVVTYDEYDPETGLPLYETTTYESTDISFSPDLIAGGNFTLRPFQNFEIRWNTKYVGRQYLDNTGSENKSLNPFTVTDLRLEYNLKTGIADNIKFHLLLANLFDENYAPNGYTYSYIYGNQRITENFYYPMAGFNFLGGLKIDF